MTDCPRHIEYKRLALALLAPLAPSCSTISISVISLVISLNIIIISTINIDIINISI